jgi:asparagine synthase (glutamine-hydrolysing)
VSLAVTGDAIEATGVNAQATMVSIPRSDGSNSVEVNVEAGTATLSSDVFGLHPIYHTRQHGADWYASDLRLLMRLRPSWRMDALGLHSYLSCSHTVPPNTLVCGISVLEPGSDVQIAPGAATVTRHGGWSGIKVRAETEDAAVKRLRSILSESIARRVSGRDDVGVYLSGGLDSSLIAAMLCEAGVRPRLYTLDFGAPFNEEVAFAHAVAQHLGLSVTVVRATKKDIRRELPTTASALHQPFGDAVTVPLRLLGAAASRDVSVVFNGEGGDQLFGGWANKPMLAAELYGVDGYDRDAEYLKTFHRFLDHGHALYSPEALASISGCDERAWVHDALNQDADYCLLHRLRAANLRLKGALNIAPRFSQIASSHGLEVEAPFLDKELAEWSFTLPPDYLLKSNCEKYLLKRVAETYLPSDVVWREKRGMGVPATEWCEGEFRRDIGRRFSPKAVRTHGWFRPELLHELRKGSIADGEYRQRRMGEKLWTLLMLDEWLRTCGRPVAWPTERQPT